MSPACRTPNAAIPPLTTPTTAPTATSDGQPGHAPPRTPATTRLATVHPAASPAAPGNNAPGRPLSHRPPAHTPPPNGGFCTIRRTATACRRRVAPLMLQFPPHTTPATAPRGRLASCTGPRPVACPPGHRSPSHTPPPNGGFCTIRRIATACRRRVAPLMLQFPPFARANRHLARHQRRITGPRPRTSQSPATTGGNFVLHQLFRHREIKPIHVVQTVTN